MSPIMLISNISLNYLYYINKGDFPNMTHVIHSFYIYRRKFFCKFSQEMWNEFYLHLNQLFGSLNSLMINLVNRKRLINCYSKSWFFWYLFSTTDVTFKFAYIFLEKEGMTTPSHFRSFRKSKTGSKLILPWTCPLKKEGQY